MLVHYFPPVTSGLRPLRLRRAMIGDLRRIHLAAAWGGMSWGQRLARLAAMPVWPLVVLVSSLAWQVPRHGRRARIQGGRSIPLQVLDQLRLAITANMWPHHYYMFELYRPELRARAHEYLLRQETKHGAFTILKDEAKKNRTFAHKDDFATACAAAGLPHVAIIARISRGEVTWSNGHATLPPIDLFIKPVKSQGGRGAERWRWRDGVYEGAGGVRVTAGTLLERLRQQAPGMDVLIMPCLANHPAFAGLALGALSTLRIVTCRNEIGAPEVMATALRFPRRDEAVVDNFHAGGLAALVDLSSGIVGPATDMGLSRDSAWYARHPVTDVVIDGFEVPFWPEAKALAETAHVLLGDRVIVGWDVAILPDGPCLIEANGFPDLDIIQRCGRMPLGQTRICGLLLQHLRVRYPIWRRRSGLA
jgi:hypothetical protein